MQFFERIGQNRNFIAGKEENTQIFGVFVRKIADGS